MDVGIFKTTFDSLPDLIKFYCAIAFVILFFIWVIFKFMIKPSYIATQSFFSKTLNRRQNELRSIISDTEIDSSDNIKKECRDELIYRKKLNLVQCGSREVGIYFYELTNKSKHLIPYTKFKRLYSYIEFIDGKPSISSEMIKKSNRWGLFTAIFLFLLMIISIFPFIYFSSLYKHTLGIIPILISLFFIGFFEIYGLEALSKIIHKKEIDEFVKTTNYYNDDVQIELAKQSISIK